jgi:hypothetical protein
MTNIVLLKQQNAQRWHDMHLRDNRIHEFGAMAKRLCEQARIRRGQGVKVGH